MEKKTGKQFSIGDVVFYRLDDHSKVYYKGEFAGFFTGGRCEIVVKTLLQKKSRQFSETSVLVATSNIVHEEAFPAIEAGKTKVVVQRGSSTSSIKTEILSLFFFNHELNLFEFFLSGDDFSYTGKNIGFFRTAADGGEAEEGGGKHDADEIGRLWAELHEMCERVDNYNPEEFDILLKRLEDALLVKSEATVEEDEEDEEDGKQQQGTPPPPPHSPTIYSLTHSLTLLTYFLSSLAHNLSHNSLTN